MGCGKNFRIRPCVFAINREYQIFIPFEFCAIVWIEVNDEKYYDDSNGILRSNNLIHRIIVPMDVLDNAQEYTVVYKKMIERKPYYPISEEPIYEKFDFLPIKDGKIKVYHIADTHNMEKEPITAAKNFGDDINLLILNGDIPNHSGDIKNFNSIYNITFEITKGKIPAVFTRGNHDTRGIFAENFTDYTPNDNGRTYYTFRLGTVWGMVLDCGEDKIDSNEEYAGTVCFHNYRLRQTEFIENVIANSANEFNQTGIKHKIIICHIPFVNTESAPVEREIYSSWTNKICSAIKPELMLFGHTHKKGVYSPKSEFDSFGKLNCIAIVGSDLQDGFEACGITLSDNEPEIVFTSGNERMNKIGIM